MRRLPCFSERHGPFRRLSVNSDLERCMAVLGGLKATAGMNEGARNRLAVDAVCCALLPGMSKRVVVFPSGAPT